MERELTPEQRIEKARRDEHLKWMVKFVTEIVGRQLTKEEILLMKGHVG